MYSRREGSPATSTRPQPTDIVEPPSPALLKEILTTSRGIWYSPAPTPSIDWEEVLAASRRFWSTPAPTTTIRLEEILAASHRMWSAPASVDAR